MRPANQRDGNNLTFAAPWSRHPESSGGLTQRWKGADEHTQRVSCFKCRQTEADSLEPDTQTLPRPTSAHLRIRGPREAGGRKVDARMNSVGKQPCYRMEEVQGGKPSRPSARVGQGRTMATRLRGLPQRSTRVQRYATSPTAFRSRTRLECATRGP